MRHVLCDCGGIISSLNRVQGFRCERCEKEYKLYELEYDYLVVNEMTGWVFPMKWSENDVRL